MSPREAYFRLDAYEDPILTVEDTGWSDLAVHSGTGWDGRDRPEGWIGNEPILMIHTCGSQLPEVAFKNGVYPSVRAQKHYGRTHGCHYTNCFQGHFGGDLVQLAWEGEQANGAGMKDQRVSVQKGRFKQDLTPKMFRVWSERWKGYRSPMDLLPGTRTANSVCIHVECIPVTKSWRANFGKMLPTIGGNTMWFTEAQHLTVAALACDIAARKGWEGPWWRTPALLGHSDLSPISRQNSRGGWDPGAMYTPQRFSWELVIREICRLEKVPFSQKQLQKIRGPW